MRVALVTFATAVMVLRAVVFTEARSPILIVPGLTASQLYKKGPLGWRGLWLGLKLCLNVNSALKDLSLVFNPATGKYQNQSGVDIRTSGFGDTCKTEYLFANPIETGCGKQRPIIPYFDTMVKYFVKQYPQYYKRGVTIRAAPYDWRLAQDQLQASGYYSRVQSLIETMYREGDYAKVTIVAHSMGGPVSLFFLNNVVTQQWKDKYINAFIPLSGAWSGGNFALAAVISGGINASGIQHHPLFPSLRKYCHGLPPSLSLALRNAARTFPSVSTLLPKPSVWGKTVLVKTPNRSYTANDYEALFADMNHPLGFEMYTSTSIINEGFPAPNVPVFCFYGTNIPTPETFTYDSGFPNTVPRVMYGDGDNTVNLLSSEVCLDWANQQAQPFQFKAFPGVSHGKMVSNKSVRRAIEAIVQDSQVQ